MSSSYYDVHETVKYLLKYTLDKNIKYV